MTVSSTAALLVLAAVALLAWPHSRTAAAAHALAVSGPAAGARRSVRRARRDLAGTLATASTRTTRVVAVAVGGVGGGLVGTAVSRPLGLVVGLVAVAAVVSGRRYLVARRGAADRTREVAAVAALADELQSGQSMAAALQAASATAGPNLGGAFRAAARAVDIGADGVEVLVGVGQEESVAADRVAGMWRLSIEAGCPLAESMQTLEADLRDEARHRDQVRALLAGPASSAFLLAGLPVFGLLMGGAVGADPWRVLTGTPIGGVVLLLGSALSATGVLWTRAIIRRARRAA